jgi:hypothetical protein
MPPVSRLPFAVPLAVFSLLLAGAACGRTTSASPGDDQDAAPGDVARTTEGGIVDPSLDGGAPKVDSGSMASAPDATTSWDAGDPETDAGCSDLALILDPDATPGTCEISPADVACDTAADCTLLMVGHCGCTTDVYGVSKTSTASCPMPPCPPPINGPCIGPGYETQDCMQTSYDAIGVSCVGHTCRSFTPIEH